MASHNTHKRTIEGRDRTITRRTARYIKNLECRNADRAVAAMTKGNRR